MADMMTILRDLVNGGIIGILAKGGIVMIPLLAASVISLAVIIERYFFWRRLRKRANDTIILQFVEAGNVEQAQKLANESWHPVARVHRREKSGQIVVVRHREHGAAHARDQRQQHAGGGEGRADAHDR